MKRRLIISVLLLLGLCALSDAQGLKTELQRTFNAYGISENLTLDFEVWIYEQAGSVGQLEGKGRIRKKGGQYYSHYLDDEMMFSEKGAIEIDHSTMRMIYNRSHQESQVAPEGGFSMEQVSEYISGQDSIRKNIGSNGQVNYTIYNGRSPFQRVELLVDPTTNLFSRIIYFFPPETDADTYGAQRMEIIYTKRSTSEAVSPSWFRISKYISAKGEKVVPCQEFKDYKLHIES